MTAYALPPSGIERTEICSLPIVTLRKAGMYSFCTPSIIVYELGPVNSDINTIRLISRIDLTLELIELDFNEIPPNDASCRLTT